MHKRKQKKNKKELDRTIIATVGRSSGLLFFPQWPFSLNYIYESGEQSGQTIFTFVLPIKARWKVQQLCAISEEVESYIYIYGSQKFEKRVSLE